MSSYCDFVKTLPKDHVHRVYHDTEYGFEIRDDNRLFERLILEINQAGLSWTTILNKKKNFAKAYDNFEIKKIAKYGEKETERLLKDAGIIRNKLKIGAAIANAQRIQDLQKKHGSFKAWLLLHKGKKKEEWVKLFKENFKFTGGEIVGEFLMSIGFLPGAHDEKCSIGKKVSSK